MNRFYNPRMGRFMSADPSGIASASLSNPQSLHRYAYVLNNPLIGIDPLGLECVYINDSGGGVQEVDPTDPNDHGSGTDSASCAQSGGYFFDGNNEVNFDKWTADGGNWGNFDFDPASNWVSLNDDNGQTGQFNCQGDACGIGSLSSFASAEFGTTMFLYDNDDGIDKLNYYERGRRNLRDNNLTCGIHGTIYDASGLTQFHTDSINPQGPGLPPTYAALFAVGHFLNDVLPDLTYDATGHYLFSPGRIDCK
jgi:hypothetical protein